MLDNAGNWLEHGLSYIDRDSLEGKKRSNRTPNQNLIAFDEELGYQEIHIPQEVIGFELVEPSPLTERLLIFESFLSQAKAHQHKLVSATYRYMDYLVLKETNISMEEIIYCHKRLNYEGYIHKFGFWNYRKIEIEDALRIKEILMK